MPKKHKKKKSSANKKKAKHSKKTARKSASKKSRKTSKIIRPIVKKEGLSLAVSVSIMKVQDGEKNLSRRKLLDFQRIQKDSFSLVTWMLREIGGLPEIM